MTMTMCVFYQEVILGSEGTSNHPGSRAVQVPNQEVHQTSLVSTCAGRSSQAKKDQ